MKIEKLTITKIFINHESKEKKPFITDKGKKFWKIAIQVDEKDYKGEYLSSLIFNEDDERFNWQVGQQISVIVERNGQYLNFSIPTRFDRLEIRVNELEELIKTPDGRMIKEPEEIDDEIKAENLPF